MLTWGEDKKTEEEEDFDLVDVWKKIKEKVQIPIVTKNNTNRKRDSGTDQINETRRRRLSWSIYIFKNPLNTETEITMGLAQTHIKIQENTEKIIES